MPAPLSEDLRIRILRARQRGKSYDEIAEHLDVGRASVSRVLRLHRETGSLAPRTPRIPPQSLPILDEEKLATLKEIVDANPDLQRWELANELEERIGCSVSPSTLGRALRKLGYTRKKRRS